MTKRRRILVANWKMNGRLNEGQVLSRAIAEQAKAASPLPFDIVLCPPATLTWAIGEAVSGAPLQIGGQDCHTETQGAFTGDLSAAMFADLGCRYVILGHSERRQGHNEANALIAKKVEAAQAAGLTAIVCVGESAEQLAKEPAAEIIARQVRESLPANAKMSDIIIAYEPIWAIGTGKVPTPDEIVTVIQGIRKALGDAGASVRVLYGGSVNGGNAGAIIHQEDVDGFLVGGASLKPDSFWQIAEKFI